MKIKRVLDKINEFFPMQTAMQGDRIGLQLQSGLEEVSNILIAMEVNGKVVDEAITNNCELIISFHPLIFAPLTFVDESNRVGTLVTKLIQNKIALITIHTNFDSYIEGTSKILSDKLGLIYDSFLVADPKIPNYGMGIIGHFETAVSEELLLEKVKNICNSPLRFNRGGGKEIQKVAIVGGSGTSFMAEALKNGVDAFITADVTYHRFHEVDGKMMLIDPGHYEMEQFVPVGLLEFFQNNFDKSEYGKIMLSQIRTNPVNYYPDGDSYENAQNKYLINNYKWI